jgi:putative phage-type endonuclease
MKTPAGKFIAVDHSPQWYDARLTGIGASESAAACGIGKYETPLSLYHRKRGEIAPPEENDLMWFGSMVQPAIANRFTEKTGLAVVDSPLGLFEHDDHPHVLASPDASIMDGTTQGGEWKSIDPNYAATLKLKDGEPLPASMTDWVCQAQQQMAVCGFERVHFGVLVNRTVKHFIVERHDELISSIIRNVNELWERIENGDPPPMDYGHQRSGELLKELHPGTTGQAIELSESSARAWAEYQEIGKTIRQLEKERPALKNAVLEEIGGHAAGVLPGGEKMVKRSQVNRKESIVKASSFWTCRAVKYDGTEIVDG